MAIIIESGVLYIVATPIGHLADISERAKATIEGVDVLYAEDTRHSHKLLTALGINRSVQSLHEHNESERVPRVLQRLTEGESVAVISDAGTPLISDPGFRLVEACHDAGIRVSPVPGPCAPIAALSVAGLASDRFMFCGFLPNKSAKRRQRMAMFQREQATLVFFESSHRIAASLSDAVSCFGPERQAVMARELTKRFETIRRATLKELSEWVVEDKNQQLGEFVLLIEGAVQESVSKTELLPWLQALLLELPPKRAAAVVAKVGGLEKREVYQWAMALKNKSDPESEAFD